MNKTDISKLNSLLVETLDKEIKNDSVVLIDLPNYYNPGDQLIWEGEESILSQLKKKVKYRASVHFFNPKMVSEKDCIVMQGGGNFGDLYTKHQNFREYIISNFPNNKVIILPVTVHFSDKNNLNKSASFFSHHKNLTICSRDDNSYKLLKKHFNTNNILLLPDTAFAIKHFNIGKTKVGNKVLFLSRTDKERLIPLRDDSFSFIKNLTVTDWPTYENKYFTLSVHLLILYINRIILKIHNIFGVHWSSNNDVHGIIKLHSKDNQIQSAINLLSSHDLIITSRLHGHIAACILGIPNILIDNSYGKNKNFYNTWMKGEDFTSYFAQTSEDVKIIVAKLSLA